MSSLNKYKKLFILLVLIIGVFYYLEYKNIINILDQKEFQVYSRDPKNINEAKEKLVPVDFPIPKEISSSDEFQKSLNSLLEYTNSWVSFNSLSKNEGLYVKYLNENGWSPFVVKVSDNVRSISGEKGNVVLNVFVQDLGDSTSKVQVHL